MSKTSEPIDVSVVLVNYNSGPMMVNCLEHLYRSNFDGTFEVLVVNNSPGDDCEALMAQHFPRVQVLSPGKNLGFGPACNLAFPSACGEFLLLLNPDAFVPPDALQKAVAHLRSHPQAAIAGAALVTETGQRQPSARRFQTWFDKLFVLSGLADRYPRNKILGRVDMTWWERQEPWPVEWVVGAFFMMRAGMGRQLDFFDERFFLYWEEVDLCRRAIARGWQVHYLPHVMVPHIGGACSEDMDPTTVDASQVTLFRLFGEALYYGKYRGRLGVLAMLGLELWWFRARWLKNRLSGKPGSADKARAMARHTRLIKLAIRETAMGTRTPDKPWSPNPGSYQEGL